MSLQDRLERLDPRERLLFNILVAFFFAFLVLGLPLGCNSMLSAQRTRTADLRAVIEEIESARRGLEKREAEMAAVERQYRAKAPALAGYLEGLAKAEKLEIPESQDKPPVPHGKRFVERSTKFSMRKVPMYNLVRFLEKIETSRYNLSVTRLNIRKRGNKHDEYDVEIVVSAFDLQDEPKATTKSKKSKTSGSKG